jgi:type III pantothenate kinase
MELLVDVGNTNIKWTFHDEGVLGEVTSLALRPDRPQVLEDAWGVFPRPERIWVSNVAGDEAEYLVSGVAQRLWELHPDFARSSKHGYGVTIAYSVPKRLGVDRWLALIAVHNAHMGPAIVLDCGTAVTLDALDAAGRHLGGLIVPGLRMMWDCLFARTRIPQASYTDTQAMLGKDTGECIVGGAVQAITGMTERLRFKLRSENAFEPAIVLTGSDARPIGRQLDFPWLHEPNLVLKGLAILD